MQRLWMTWFWARIKTLWNFRRTGRGSRITNCTNNEKENKEKKGDILTTFGTLEYSTKVCVDLTANANATASVTLHEMMGCDVIFCKIVIKGVGL